MDRHKRRLNVKPAIAFNTIVGEPIIDGEICRVFRPYEDGRHSFEVIDTGKIKILTEGEFHHKLRTGEFVPESMDAERQPTLNIVQSFNRRIAGTRTEIEDANYHCAIATAVMDQEGEIGPLDESKWIEVIERAHFKFREERGFPKWLVDKAIPSHWSAKRWIRRAKRSRDPLSYLFRYAECGTSGNRLNPGVNAVLRIAIDDEWVKHPRSSRGALIEPIRTAIQKAIDTDPRLYGCKVPSESSIRRRINDLGGEEVLTRMKGKRAAHTEYKDVEKGPDVSAPNERWEMDHHTLDVLICDKVTKKIVGRAWLTIVLDYYTRGICSFVISIGYPDSATVLEAIRLAILPKSEEFLQSIGAKCGWPMSGRPDEIATDRGSDFISFAVQSAILAMGIDCTVLPPYTAQQKGETERFFGVMNTGFVHRLPGTTKGSPKERGDVDPAEFAVMDIDDLNRELGRWICDVYHNRPNSRTKRAPLEAWQKGILRFPVKPLKSIEWLRHSTMIGREVTATRAGLQIETIRYNGDVIRRIRSKFHAATRGNPRIITFLDPEDVSQVFVADPDNNQTVPVLALDQETTKGMSWRIHAYILKKINLDYRDSKFRAAYKMHAAEVMANIAEYHAISIEEQKARKAKRKAEKQRKGKAKTQRSIANVGRPQEPPSSPPDHLKRTINDAPLKVGRVPDLAKSAIPLTRKKK